MASENIHGLEATALTSTVIETPLAAVLSSLALSPCSEQGLFFIAVQGRLSAVASLVAEHGL